VGTLRASQSLASSSLHTITSDHKVQ
jgi:hypothetical protein